MPRRDVRALLFDLIQAGEFVREDASCLDLAKYLAQRQARQAIERNLLTIGEALSRALRLDPSLHQEVTEARSIVDFRNLMIHGYDVIDHETVWGIVTHYVPRAVEEARLALERRSKS